MPWSLLALVGILASGMTFNPAVAQTGGRFFAETGHTLDTRFLDYFDRHGGTDIFGFPITESFSDPDTDQLIQYTENVRFEWVIDEEGIGHAALRPLGEILGGWYLPDESSQGDGRGCRYFEESGHAICYAFLAFFNTHGGQDLFGLPISDFVIQNDRIVQYFQFFRLDWYPDAPEPDQIRVGALGREHFRIVGYDPALLQPVSAPNNQDYRITEIRPSASVGNPSIAPGQDEAIYLVVRDQNLLPVEGAVALLVVHSPAGDRYFLMPKSDAQGLSQLSFSIGEVARGSKINVDLWVVHAGFKVVIRDSFGIR
ncbi:MAG: hypothetical protein WBR18_10725 [Anaerolineales bacterium]